MTRPLLITGARGAIGTHLATTLAAQGLQLRLTDRHPRTDDLPADAEFIRADLRDPAAADRAAAATAAIIHLAATTHEAPFTKLINDNILTTHHVLEAARHHHIPRVVLASSHHVTGLYPPGTGHHDQPFAPDSFYAVSKITVEALGYVYAHKTGVEVVAIRIGSFRAHPSEPRHRATWLSPQEATALFFAAATRPLPQPFLLITSGTSNNTNRWWTRTGWDQIGYEPDDDAERLVNQALPLTERWAAGQYAQNPLPTTTRKSDVTA